MGRVIAIEHVTLDGVMQAPGHPDEDRRDGFQFGSGVLIRSLLPHHLVDELVLLIHPLVLGSGPRLFPESSSDRSTLELVEAGTTETGVIIAIYQPAG